MGYLKSTNLETGKVEHESGIRPEPFFTDKNAARNPQERQFKTLEELSRDVFADAAYQDFKRRGKAHE